MEQAGAAAAAGVLLRTEVPLRDGAVMLPRLGLGRLPGPGPFSVATATVEGDRIALVSSGQRVEVRADGTGWAAGGANGGRCAGCGPASAATRSSDQPPATLRRDELADAGQVAAACGDRSELVDRDAMVPVHLG